MPLIPWLKKTFGPKPAPKKAKELTDEELALLKVQYKNIIEHASKTYNKKSLENREYCNKQNGTCPKCKGTNVNDRIKRFEGDIKGSSSGYGYSALSFGQSYSSGSISGHFDTNEVNKCNDCDNEWKKYKYSPPTDTIEHELRNVRYFFSDLHHATHQVTWDKNDLKETFNSLEEKKADALKKAQEGTWAYSVKNFWKDYSIELINKLAEELWSASYSSFYLEDFKKYYDYEALRKYCGLRSIDEFLSK